MTTPINSTEGGLRLLNAGQQLLDAVLTAAAVHLHDLPAKQFVTTGAAVYDCEQVSVSLLRINSGIGMGQDAALVQGGPSCQFGWTVIAEVAIVRCAPAPNVKGIITADRLEGSTERTSKDIFVLTTAIEAVAESSYGGFTASLIPDEPNGGFVTAAATIGMPL